MEFKALQKEPVEGFLVTIPDDSDFYTWQVAIFGPPDTPYAGGYFKVGPLPICVALYVHTPQFSLHSGISYMCTVAMLGRDEVSNGLPLLPAKTKIPHANPTPQCLHCKLNIHIHKIYQCMIYIDPPPLIR